MTRGGARKGAGRPKGQGKYTETTKPVRIPESMVDAVMNFIDNGETMSLPLYGCSVEAGFPGVVDDHIESMIDLNQHLVKHPSATFLVRVSGESMVNAGIFPKDILIVDRSLDPKHGKIVIAALDSQLTVKRLHISNEGTYLMPENDNFSPIKISGQQDIVIWGVVTNVIHNV